MTHGPTHQFCPNCNAMLPAYLEACPRCGKRLGGAPEVSGKDVFKITGMVLLVAILPLLAIVVTGILCVNSFQ